MSDLNELADRVEALDGPDREVDAEIALTLGIVRGRDGDCFYGHRDYSVMVLERGYDAREGDAPELHHYTSSLDAAMSLVPEGWGAQIDTHGLARMSSNTNGQLPLVEAFVCQHPALALVAASLRAIHLQGEG